ncbi:unnamed protein product [Durusdinium trenchii]|uniref:Uncharacterized protein n=1 Tax=Durusdinium trenchii TaxID=1381693 RepID=A0ABP0N549_9DINO
MGREEIGRWLAFLRPSSNAVELQLSKVPIEDVDQQELSESLKSNQFLQSLWLTGNELTAEGARALGEGIASNQSLRTLRINYNGRMGVEGVEHIMNAVAANPRLQSFHFGDNDLQAEGLLIVTTALALHTGLRHLDLSWAGNIGVTGAQALAQLLRSNRRLEELRLTENDVGPEGGKAIAEAAAQSSLRLLLCDYNSIQDDGAKAIACMIRSNDTIKTLGLHANAMTAMGVEVICEALKSNKTLLNIDLRHNRCGDLGIVGEAMGMSSVREWDLRSMGLGPSAFKAIARNCAKLQKLNLEDNEPGLDGYITFADHFKGTALEELNLQAHVQAPPEAAQLSLSRCLQSNLSLRVLQLLLLGGRTSTEVTQVQLGAIKNGSALEELSADTMDDDAASLAEVISSSNLKIIRCRFHQPESLRELFTCQKGLKVLDLSSSRLTGAGGVWSELLLQPQPVAEELCLSSCALNQDDAMELAKGLASNAWLLKLSLRRNSFEQPSWEALAKAMETNGTLEDLDLVETGLNDQSFAVLAGSLKFNKSLRRLEFSGDIADATMLAELLAVNVSLREIESAGDLFTGKGVEMLLSSLETNSFLSSFTLEHTQPRKFKKDKADYKLYEASLKTIEWLVARNEHPAWVLNSSFQKGNEVLVCLRTLGGESVLELQVGEDETVAKLIRLVYERLGYLRPLRLMFADGRFWQEAATSTSVEWICSAASAGYVTA